MKFPTKQILALGVMALSSFGLYKAQDIFSPSDIDIMAGTSGALVFQEPLQKEVDGTLYTFEADGVALVPVAIFDASGVVLGKRRYLPWGSHHFAPWDIGLGWGKMSDPSLLRHVKFWQAGRFMYFRYPHDSPVGKREIIPNSANIHVIPANDEVREKLSRIKEGNIVRLTGFLVHAVDGVDVYKTSLTRHDTGAGACEILYVQDVDLDPV